jgi:hypothetical protein
MTDILKTMEAELVEGALLLDPLYPHHDKEELLIRTLAWRQWFYQNGRWPTAQALKEEEEEKKARAIAEGAEEIVEEETDFAA